MIPFDSNVLRAEKNNEDELYKIIILGHFFQGN